MNASWIGRASRALVGAAAVAMLAACGSGSVVSDLTPQRIITVGDGFTDVGQNGYRFSVNDGSNIWVQSFAANYGLTVTPANAGGKGYAQGGARVAAADTTSGTNAPSVTQQIDAMLASTTLSATDDVVIVGGGIEDIVDAVAANGISDAATAAVKAAGTALGEQIIRLVDAGAKHVLVTGVYNLGDTPWARKLGQQDAITALSVAFNSATELKIVDLGENVLFIDPALLHNLMSSKPGNYSFDNDTDAACTTPDATTCTASTIVSGADYNRWMYADDLYFTPEASRRFGTNSYSEGIYYQFNARW